MNNPQLPVKWAQGEHFSVVGDTGTGKTFLISKLVQLRKYVVILRTKPDNIKFAGFKLFRHATAMDDWHNEHILLEPKYEQQASEGWSLLDRVWRQGSWTVVIDEHWYAERLGLKPFIERLLTQGRSKDISVVVGMQRPVAVSRFTISQSTHLVTFRLEGRDLKTVAESTTPRIEEPVEGLTGHDFIYYNRALRIVERGNARTLNKLIVSPYSNSKPG